VIQPPKSADKLCDQAGVLRQMGWGSIVSSRFVELANEVAMWKVEGRDYVDRRDYDSMEKLFIAAENQGSRSRTPHK
jgi:hypothetical protein